MNRKIGLPGLSLPALAVAALAAGAAGPAAATEWWENTTVSGQMFYDLTNIDQTYHDSLGVKHDGPVSGANTSGTGFDIKRFYIQIDHTFNNVFSADVTTDTQYSGTIGATELFVKKAYIQAKFDPSFVVRLGSAELPWIPFVIGVNGYRYAETLIVNRTKNGATTDWGAHFSGDLFNRIVSYQVSFVNGNGFKNPSRAAGMDAEGRLSVTYDGFVAAVGGYDGKLGAVRGVTTYHDATRLDGLLAYVGHGARVGVEYFQSRDWKSVKSTGTDKAIGYSVFGSYDLTQRWALFGRYDHANPKSSAPASVKDDLYVAGVQYQPYNMVKMALVYKHEAVKGGNLAVSEGTIGGAVFGPGPSGQGDYSEVGLFGSFQW